MELRHVEEVSRILNLDPIDESDPEEIVSVVVTYGLLDMCSRA
jgi:hypothetical protein